MQMGNRSTYPCQKMTEFVPQHQNLLCLLYCTFFFSSALHIVLALQYLTLQIENDVIFILELYIMKIQLP